MEGKDFKSKYEILNLLGQGSFGTSSLTQEVSIK